MHGCPTRTRTFIAAGACAALAVLAAPRSAEGSINLELRPGSQSTFLGSNISLGLYAVSDSTGSQFFTAAQVVLTWNPAFLQYLGVDNTGSPLATSSVAAGDPYHLNDSLADGDLLWTGFAPLMTPIGATPGGTFLTNLNFHALAVTTPTTLVNIAPNGGSPTGFTIVFDSVVPNLSVTGTLTGANIQIQAPAPGGALVMLAGVMAMRGRRRRA